MTSSVHCLLFFPRNPRLRILSLLSIVKLHDITHRVITLYIALFGRLGTAGTQWFFGFLLRSQKSRHQATLGNATFKNLDKVNKLSILINQQY